MYGTYHQQNCYAVQASYIHSSLLHQWQSVTWPLKPLLSHCPTINIQLAGKHWSITGKHWGNQVIKWCSTINTNLPANTETMSITQHRNSSSVTNKENISNKSGHSTTTLRKYLKTPAELIYKVWHYESAVKSWPFWVDNNVGTTTGKLPPNQFYLKQTMIP